MLSHESGREIRCHLGEGGWVLANLENKVALIVGAGSGLSASIARSFAGAGMKVALAARSVSDLGPLAAEIGATAFTADATDRGAVSRLFADLADILGDPYAVVYNASYRTRGPFTDLDPAEVEKSLAVTAFGGFLVSQEAARRMLPKAAGAILFTGASASVKGYAQSAPFAMGKFALRGLAQSMARELTPQGIHVAHVVVDGGIRSARRPDATDRPDATLDPDAIAASYLHLLRQDRSAWTWEIEVRPWVEKF
jgi:NAD(P)-dependent dehydrogenase (short-subunit alcohol dehydrogenase family)